MHRGLLFDLDGVLVDTAKYHYRAWNEIAGKLGFSLTLADNERLKGVSRQRSLEIILEIGGLRLAPQEFARLCEEKNERYLEFIHAMRPEELFPGVRVFLEEAKRSGRKTALGTASRNSSLILEKLGLRACFDAVIDGNQVRATKPDPEVFLRGAEALGLRPDECLVFEDAEAGIEAAHRAGMFAVGIGRADALPEADIQAASLGSCSLEQIELRLAEKKRRGRA